MKDSNERADVDPPRVVEVEAEGVDEEGNLVIGALVAEVERDDHIVAADETIAVVTEEGDVLVDETFSVVGADGELHVIEEDRSTIAADDEVDVQMSGDDDRAGRYRICPDCGGEAPVATPSCGACGRAFKHR